MDGALVIIDADLAQCLQSCREQVAANEVPDRAAAKELLASLGKSLKNTQDATKQWGGEFALEKGQMALEGDWKL